MIQASKDAFDLHRFIDAQRAIFPTVIAELSAGRKRTHWMWFVFPQLAGLGHSAMARRFAIGSIGETQACFAHGLLGSRLVESTRLVMAASATSINEILGSPDDLKFRSSMTLFDAVTKHEVFAEAIGTFFPGGKDRATLELLRNAAHRFGRRAQADLSGQFLRKMVSVGNERSPLGFIPRKETAMTMTRERRPEFRSQESWAIGTLLAAGAIHECDDHGYMKDRADPHARDDAFQMARHQPFPGLSPDEAVKAVQDFLHTVGDTCPSCV